jgi:hypothetical protein
MEIHMNTLLKLLLAAIAIGGVLTGCATYDGYGYSEPYSYGYGYSQPYDGYGYGPYYYDYGPYYGGPGYYAGPPAVGFDFRFRDGAHRERRHLANDHLNRFNSRSPRTAQRAPTRQANRTRMTDRRQSRAIAQTHNGRGSARTAQSRADQHG